MTDFASTPILIRRARRKIIKATSTKEQDPPSSKQLSQDGLPPEAPVVASAPVEPVDGESVIQETLRMAYRRILLELSSLPRSILVMISIAALSAVGTVIEQGKSLDFYMENYPDGEQKMLGFLTYQILLFFQLDHIYTAPYFYGLIGLLVAQLMACTSTRQWPIAKAAQRWRFKKTTKAVARLENAEILPDANIRDLGAILSQRGYEIFIKDGSLYAFRNLVGRLAPIGVHAALLLTIAGISWGVFGGFKGSVMIPEDGEIPIEQALVPNSPLAILPSSSKGSVHVDRFKIDYRSDGSIAQFYSDLSITDVTDGSSLSKKISVNDPLRYRGITLYQTDWSMAAIRVTLESDDFEEKSTSIKLPMASLPQRKDNAGRVFATFIPLPNNGANSRTPRGISVLARDFQSVILYDSEGEFAGVRRPGSGKPIEIDGMKITVDDIIGSTGLEFKSDPGVPVVYAGFAGLMITTLLSYLSHSQIWALQNGRDLHLGGKSNRLGFLFDQELSTIIDMVPDSGSESVL
eukprot:g2119.t1